MYEYNVKTSVYLLEFKGLESVSLWVLFITARIAYPSTGTSIDLERRKEIDTIESMNYLCMDRKENQSTKMKYNKQYFSRILFN